MSRLARWAPAVVLGLCALGVTAGVKAQRTLPLRAGLAATIPATLDGYTSRDGLLSEEEERVVGVSDYLLRSYLRADSADTTRVPSLQIYIGYYERQTQGKTIHSPKNCLPGAGWEALSSSEAEIDVGGDTVRVNRYLLQRGNQSALVLYWYQGRGRVAWNEYAVKWDLLRDAALLRRSEEALVRVVVPITDSQNRAFEQGVRAVRALVPAVYAALPA